MKLSDNKATLSFSNGSPNVDLPDNELWDVIAGRQPPADASVAPMVAALQAA